MIKTIPYGAEETFDKKNSALIYHNPGRCGGTTFETILENSFDNLYLAVAPTLWPDIIEKMKTARGTIAVSGHAGWGFHEHLPRELNAFYLTTLRHPVDICRSYHKGHEQQLCSPSRIEDFVEKLFTHNQMVLNLGNGDLEIAKERLLYTYYLFGVVEHYDSSMQLFSRYLPLQTRDFKLRNVTCSAEIELDKKLENRIIEKSWKDYELYRWALEIFKNRLAEAGLPLSKNNRVTFYDKLDTGSKIKVEDHVYPLIRQGKIAEAITEIETREPLSVIKMLQLRNLYAKLGDWDRYTGCMEKANQLRKDAFQLSLAQFYRKDNPEKSIETIRYLLDTYSPYATETPDSPLNLLLSQCYLELGCIYHEQKEYIKAKKYFDDVPVDAFYRTAIQQYTELLYDKKEFAEIERFITTAFKREVIVFDKDYKRLAVKLYENGREEEAFAILNAGIGREQEKEIGAFETETMEKVFEPGQHILVIRSAPFIVAGYFCNRNLPPMELSFSMLTAKGTIPAVRKKWQDIETYYLPDGMFDYGRDVANVDPAVYEGKFDALVILMNNPDFRAYRHVYDLALQLKTKIYFYCFEQMGSEQYRGKILLPPGTENSAESTAQACGR
ncbi:MAG: hypothetical protein GY757_46605 [bacterium]|nr:hypothetical protein [bacterium]